jgi:hypothetical protein
LSRASTKQEHPGRGGQEQEAAAGAVGQARGVVVSRVASGAAEWARGTGAEQWGGLPKQEQERGWPWCGVGNTTVDAGNANGENIALFYIDRVCRGEESKHVGQSIGPARSVRANRRGTDARGGTLPIFQSTMKSK